MQAKRKQIKIDFFCCFVLLLCFFFLPPSTVHYFPVSFASLFPKKQKTTKKQHDSEHLHRVKNRLTKKKPSTSFSHLFCPHHALPCFQKTGGNKKTKQNMKEKTGQIV